VNRTRPASNKESRSANRTRPVSNRERRSARRDRRAVETTRLVPNRNCGFHETHRDISNSHRRFAKTTVDISSSKRRSHSPIITKTENCDEQHDQVHPSSDHHARPAEERARAHLLRPGHRDSDDGEPVLPPYPRSPPSRRPSPTCRRPRRRRRREPRAPPRRATTSAAYSSRRSSSSGPTSTRSPMRIRPRHRPSSRARESRCARRPGAARAFAAKPGPVAGVAKVTAVAASRRASYEWQYSPDRGKTWVTAPPTLQARFARAGCASRQSSTSPKCGRRATARRLWSGRRDPKPLLDVSETSMRNAILPCIGSETWGKLDPVRLHWMPPNSVRFPPLTAQ
jgi:hypothetical protein